MRVAAVIRVEGLGTATNVLMWIDLGSTVVLSKKFRRDPPAERRWTQ